MPAFEMYIYRIMLAFVFCPFVALYHPDVKSVLGFNRSAVELSNLIGQKESRFI